ncbi:DNA primase [Blattabacterium cuenoti]|uniref:DNA primase n=1 Tax=Blattabacterium cuenoti TaxID=1653831 RepID=UPI00163CEBCA|nr:DNA primase [Blattabacterium cuenoti]
MISKKTIERIFSISCIEEVIGDFVSLKKSGINYRGLSPFSDEKTPSLIVSPTKKIWKDFSSGKGGNIITFLMEHEHFTYVESLHYLAKKYEIDILYEEDEKNETDDNRRSVKKMYYEKNLQLIQDYAKRFFIKQLWFTKEGKEKGLRYLIKERGFNMKIIHEFELGYAPSSWSFLTEKALKKGFKIGDLKKSGITVFKEKSKNYFDCFRNRVIFPIHDLSGMVIGFGGRTIISSSCSTTSSSAPRIKYLNSSESNLFQKSKILYGLFQAKTAILKENFCYLVEGYTDVISLHQSGIKNVVSSSGTALTIDQILLIKKFTKTIVLFYDGDKSGIQASLRGINMFLEQEMNPRILFFSNGEDPDSLAKKYSSSHSHSQWKYFLEKNSYNFISFKKKVYDLLHQNDPIGKSFLVVNILNSILKISNILQKELFLQEASRVLELRQEVLISELERIKSKKKRKSIIYSSFLNKKNKKIITDSNQNLILEEKLIQFIFNHGDQIIKKGEHETTTVLEKILHTFKCENLRFSLYSNQKLFDKICKKKNQIGKLKNFKQYKKFCYSLSEWEKKGIEVTSEDKNIEKSLTEMLLRYKLQSILKSIQKEIMRFQNIEADDPNHKNQKKNLIKKIMHLTNLKNELNKKLHRYV